MFDLSRRSPISADDMENFIACAESLIYFTRNCITYQSWGVVDLIGDKIDTVDEVTRAKILHKFLKTLEIDPEARVFIEYQPPKIGAAANNKSTAVSNQLLMYYINHDVKLVNPKLKSTVSLAPGLEFEVFLAAEFEGEKKRALAKKSKDAPTRPSKDARYRAQKRHSQANFEYFVKIFELTVLNGLAKPLWNHLADSTMQALATLAADGKFA